MEATWKSHNIIDCCDAIHSEMWSVFLTNPKLDWTKSVTKSDFIDLFERDMCNCTIHTYSWKKKIDEMFVFEKGLWWKSMMKLVENNKYFVIYELRIVQGRVTCISYYSATVYKGGINTPHLHTINAIQVNDFFFKSNWFGLIEFWK